MRKQSRICCQQTKATGRGANHSSSHETGHELVHENLVENFDQSSNNAAQQINPHQAFGAQGILESPSKEIDDQHVENQVNRTAMEELIRHQLPDVPVSESALAQRQKTVTADPKQEVVNPRKPKLEDLLQNVNDDIQNDEDHRGGPL